MGVVHGGLFEGVEWGTERVLAQTLARAEAMGLRVRLLQTLRDVDDVADLEVWNRCCRSEWRVEVAGLAEEGARKCNEGASGEKLT
eukprot:CAMPEP_0174910994 /NCGR_PEP_ID=MMETSP0167-20121228/74869_1 /TAXON_ID=38298 /ORGANISM="Rhodella maculata, Strain CCMP736" /LENGTH=85 /DNA_ID=CAMNT_0016155399 /DNA_START=60 /DNA_END=317 /DNA_ORIENTATION=+